MKKNSTLKSYMVALVFMLTSSVIVNAQTFIKGERYVLDDTESTYQLITDETVTNVVWEVFFGGTIVGYQYDNGIATQVTVKWDEQLDYGLGEGGVLHATVYTSNPTPTSTKKFVTFNVNPNTVFPTPLEADQNYVKQSVFTDDTGTKSLKSITYIDGIGRPLQKVDIQAGGDFEDIVTPFVYDGYGRQEKDYLPYAAAVGNSGSLRINPIEEAFNFYNTEKYENTLNPFSKKEIENSALGRVLEQGAPGDDWEIKEKVNDNETLENHTIKFDYAFNVEDEVIIYTVDFANNDKSSPELNTTGFYEANELYKTITKDENWFSGKNHTTEEFKDKNGKVILKRTYADVDLNANGTIEAAANEKEVPHDTYYVYDIYDNLTFVLPPKASDQLTVQTSPLVPYNNFSVSIPHSEFTGSPAGGGTVTASINNDVLSVNFSAGFANTQINHAGYTLNTTPCLIPNMELGYLTTNTGNNTDYSAKIENGKLVIVNHNNVSINAFSGTFTVNLDGCGGGASLNPTPEVLDNLCYQYTYDLRNRLIEKKIPGKGPEHIVYDKLDRPVLTQDEIQRSKSTKEWLFTKYDVLGRVVYTGLYKDNSTRAQLQAILDAQSNLYETSGSAIYNYTNQSYPVGINVNDIYTVNYYDNYDNLPTGLTNTVMVGNKTSTTKTKGLSTITKIKVLETSTWITSVTYYDDKARPIYTYSKNDYLNTVDIIKSELDFLGKPIKTISSHTKSGTTIVTIDNFTYDHTGRLLSQTQCVGDETMGDTCSGNIIADLTITSGTITTDQIASSSITVTNATLSLGAHLFIDTIGSQELIVYNTYDELGQLEKKKVGGKLEVNVPPAIQAGLQTVDYKYNVRGWLKQINDPTSLGTDLFGFKIAYNEGNHTLFNGNISSTQWKTANTDSSLKMYNYQYDALNRILSGVDNTGHYNLNSINYDKNGNIVSLSREGHLDDNNPVNFNTMDNLSYYYQGNQLHSVTDSSGYITGFKDGNTSDGIYNNGDDDFDYDANGNMVIDKNKKISSIEYNHLNLPTRIIFDDPSTYSSAIDYKYDALGTKLEKAVAIYYQEGAPFPSYYVGTEYAGSYVYQKTFGQPVLQFFNHPEGYVELDGNNFNYIYQYKDHLGNVRLSYRDADGNGTVTTSEILEENNYYPFGLQHKGYNNVVNGTEHPYDYNGKENNKELGLNWHDFGARNYDAALGRWMNLDPLAEQMRRHSPYNYAFNNPMRFTDPDGMAPDDVIIKGGEKAAAFAELQASVAGQLTLSMDAGGKVSYTQVAGSTLTGGAQQLTTAIDDSSITVNLEAENTMTTKSGSLYIGGAFSGNTVTTTASGNTVDATNEINPGVLGTISTAHGKPGAEVLHEVTESYQGAKIAQSTGVSTGPATGADISNPTSVYNRAHNAATPQSGNIYETLYDAAGAVIPMPASGIYPSTVRSVEWSVNNTSGTRVVIQTLK